MIDGDPIFDFARCGRDPLPSIVGRTLVASCAIPDPPKPIVQGESYLLALTPSALPSTPGVASGTTIGRVTGGHGSLWTVRVYPEDLYPDGPGGHSLGHASLPGTDVTVQVLGIANNGGTAWKDDWISPIYKYPGSANGSEDGTPKHVHVRQGAGKLAWTPPGGIPARGPGTPGIPQAARCIIYKFTGDAMHSIGENDVYNSTHMPVAAAVQKLIQTKVIDGFLFADVEDCDT